MPQLHFYVPKETAKVLRARAQAAGLPISRYLAKVVQGEMHKGWPEGYFEQVVGCWEGKPLRRPRQGKLQERDPM